jgi:hypothetical protein
MKLNIFFIVVSFFPTVVAAMLLLGNQDASMNAPLAVWGIFLLNIAAVEWAFWVSRSRAFKENL